MADEYTHMERSNEAFIINNTYSNDFYYKHHYESSAAYQFKPLQNVFMSKCLCVMI